MSKWVGVVGLDPGGTTGYVQGVVPTSGTLKRKLAKVKLRDAVQLPSANIGINGLSDEAQAARNIFNTWKIFYERCASRDIPVVTVIEDFMLVKLGSSDRSGLASVRVTSSLESLLYQYLQEQEGAGMEWLGMPWYISVSTASTTVTDQRLKDWGLWEVGKEHCRSAWRVWATYVREHSKQPTAKEGVLKACRGAASVKRFKASGKYY